MQSLRVDGEAHPLEADENKEEDEAAEVALDSSGASVASNSTLPPGVSQSELALADIVQGARARYLWGMLGWQDIRRRYRRSVLGPLWLTISMGVLVGALGTLYGTLLKVEVAEYMPFLALGFIVWTLIQSLITEGCVVFTGAEGIIKQTSLPLSVHVYRMAWRNFLIFCHNMVIFLVVAMIFSIWPGWTGLLAVPGLALICLSGTSVGLVLGIVSARFRDVPPIVASVVRIAFFVTPIIWMPELLPDRALLLDFNPFFHLVEIVRAPLLGQAPGLVSWLAVAGITIGGWAAAFALFRHYRRRIAYWV